MSGPPSPPSDARSATELLRRLGGRVRDRRTERRLTLKELAARARLSVRFVGEIEAGRGNVSLARLDRVAKALAVPLRELIPEEDSGPPVVALVGLRGAGKSTLGRRLADRRKVPFHELDQLVESTAGLSLSEIFALHGEAFYRRVETTALERLLRQSAGGSVIATGGGIVTNPDAFSLLQSGSRIVWLKADADDHWARVVRQGDRRPMARNPRAKAELKALLFAREPLYARAHQVVDTSRLGLAGSLDALDRLTRF